MNKFKYAVTHGGTAHLDDVLAAALIMYIPFGVNIARRDPTPVELEDPSVPVFDVGGEYNPERNNYDHHQDAALPCTLHLVAQNLFPGVDFTVHPWWEAVDVRDREGICIAYETAGLWTANGFGFPAVSVKFDDVVKVSSPIEQMFIQQISEADNIDPDGRVGLFLHELGQDIISFPSRYEKDRQDLKMGEITGHKYIQTTTAKNVAINREGTMAGADFTVRPNERGPGLVVTAIDNKMDFSSLRGQPGVQFVHNSGFLAVVENLGVMELI